MDFVGRQLHLDGEELGDYAVRSRRFRRGLPAHADHPAGHDDDRAALRRCARRRGTPDRSRIAEGAARAATSSICSKKTGDAGVTRFVWLRQFEPGSHSADANRLLDRLEHLRRLAVPEGFFGDIPPHRITRLRRQGERDFADGLRELPDNRRLQFSRSAPASGRRSSPTRW